MADEEASDDTAPWQIKAMPVELRKLAVASAANGKLTVAEWVGQAVALKARMDQAEHVLLPAAPDMRLAVAPYAPREPPPTPEPLDFAGLAQLIGALGEIPDGLRREAVRTMRALLRQARGLPARRQKGIYP